MNLFVIAKEATPHHLMLTEEAYEGSAGNDYIDPPPLKTKNDIERLWLKNY